MTTLDTVSISVAATRARAQRTIRRILVGAVVVFLAFAIGYPLLRLCLVAFQSDKGLTFQYIVDTATSPDVHSAFWTMISMVIPSMVMAVIIGTVLAWANARTDASLGVFGQILPLTTFIVPHIAIATGWLLLGSPDVGFLAAPLSHIPLIGLMLPSISSMTGMIFVETVTMVPFVFLVLQPAFYNLDPALEEASLSAGAGPLRTFLRVSMPATKNAVVGSALLALIVGFGEYTVPMILGSPMGLKTLSVLVLDDVTKSYPPRMGEAATIGIFMMLMTGCAWLLFVMTGREGRLSQIGGKFGSTGIIRLGPWRYVVWAVVAAFFLCATALPLIALLIVAFQPYWTPNVDVTTFTWDNFVTVFQSASIGPAIGNSALFATITAVVACIVIMFLSSAWKVGRIRSAKLGLALIKIPSAIAPLVLAVGVLVAFYGVPFNLGNTAFILIAAYVLIFLPHASILAESAVNQIRQELIEASDVAGASWMRTQLKVLGPLTAPAFVGIVSLVFTMAMGETSVSRVLAGPGTTVAGFAIIQVYQIGVVGQMAVLAAMIAAVNLTVVVLLTVISRILRKRWQVNA